MHAPPQPPQVHRIQPALHDLSHRTIEALAWMYVTERATLLHDAAYVASAAPIPPADRPVVEAQAIA